jgi:acetyl esterase/lipase
MLARRQVMKRIRISRWSVCLGLLVLLLPACTGGSDDSSDTTLAPITTVSEATTTAPTATALPASDLLQGHGPFDVTMTVVSHETTQEISVFAPEADGSWPVAFMFHCYECDRSDAAPMATQLASHGMVVFAPNYRSTGTGDEMEEDLECGYRYARSVAAEYGGDLDQPVTFVGDSYGATMAISGGVAQARYGPGGFYDDCFTGAPRPDVVVAIGDCYYEYEGEEVPWTPLEWMVDNIENATLEPHLVLVVGENDDTCHAWQSEDATDTLQAAGYNAELRAMPGGDHHNVVFWTQIDGEWVIVPNDPVGQQVVQIILDGIDAAQP